MKILLQAIRGAALAIALVVGAGQARAQQPVFDCVSVNVPSIIAYATATSSAACTLGRHGCLLTQTFNGVASATYSSFAAFPYGARAIIDYFDSGSNGTLVCTTVLVRGIDARGMTTTDETLTNVGESGATTARSYLAITRVAISGCSGGASSDLIQIHVASREVAPPVIIASSTDLRGACYKGTATNSPWWCDSTAGAARTTNGESVTYGASVLDGHSVTMQACGRRFLRRL